MNDTSAQDTPRVRVRRESADRKLFLAVMGQELRAPLDVIATCAEEALRRDWGPDSVDLLTELIASVQGVAHELADASRCEDAKSGEFPKPIEVAELCVKRMAETIARFRAPSAE